VSTVAHDINDADEQIIERLREGRNLPQNLARDLDYSRQYVQNRLQMLKAADIVENLGGGLYELVDDPREGVINDD
jgi:predicted transcriptional regulator